MIVTHLTTISIIPSVHIKCSFWNEVSGSRVQCSSETYEYNRLQQFMVWNGEGSRFSRWSEHSCEGILFMPCHWSI